MLMHSNGNGSLKRNTTQLGHMVAAKVTTIKCIYKVFCFRVGAPQISLLANCSVNAENLNQKLFPDFRFLFIYFIFTGSFT